MESNLSKFDEIQKKLEELSKIEEKSAQIDSN